MNPLKVMEECVQLALMGKGKVKSNPVVGAIIVKDNRIISRGFHSEYGGPHAEIDALQNATDSVEGADMYVTLEPCSHYGKTPPCAESIVKSGIKRVFVGVADPNPVNAGKGLKLLEDGGVDVFLGYCEPMCASIIEDFAKFITHEQPYYSLKMAQTLDGKIATSSGDSRWITSESSREYVHYLRSISDGVLIGAGTVFEDDPQLNVRFLKAENEPYKIILDSQLRTPLSSKLVKEFADRLIIFTGNGVDKVKPYEDLGVKVISVEQENDLLSLTSISKELAVLGLKNVLVEGGSHVFGSFMDAGLADKIYSFISPKLLGGGKSTVDGVGVDKIKDAYELKDMQVMRFEGDLLITGHLSSYTKQVLDLTEGLRHKCKCSREL